MSVVIPAWNAAATIGEQLHALAEQDLAASWELIVVDNGSTDDTRRIAEHERRNLGNLRVLQCATRGVNAARNTGVRAARADRILVCDADDRVLPGWVRELADGLDTWPIVGGATRLDALNDAAALRWRTNPVGATLPMAHRVMPYAIGANLGFRREVFDAIGGFDETFSTGADDVDFCWRAQEAGFELGFCPDAIVQYRLKATTSAAMRQQFHYARGEVLLYTRHVPKGVLVAPSPRQQLRSAVRRTAALGRIDRYLKRESRVGYLRRAAQLAGSVSGWARHHLFV